MSTDPRDLAFRVTVLAELADRIAIELHAARAELNDAMVTGDRITVPSGDVTLASVTKAKGRVTARVSDPDALLEWVRQHHPDEVVTVPTIRPATLARILAVSRAAGEPCFGDTLDIPGVTVGIGDPSVSLRPTDDASTEIGRLWQTGAIDLRGLLALPGGE